MVDTLDMVSEIVVCNRWVSGVGATSCKVDVSSDSVEAPLGLPDATALNLFHAL